MALQYAAILAKRSAGRLHVFHVNDPMLAAAAAVAFADPGYAKVALAELRPFVAKAVPENTRKAISIHYAVDTGDASRQIASAATKLGCDLIVMGTHGLSGLEKVLIGSTTERMLRRSSVPILAVPSIPGGADGAQAPGRGWPGAAILVPVDLGEQSTRDLRDAELIARALRDGPRVGARGTPTSDATVVQSRFVGSPPNADGEGATPARIAGEDRCSRRQHRNPRPGRSPRG